MSDLINPAQAAAGAPVDNAQGEVFDGGDIETLDDGSDLGMDAELNAQLATGQISKQEAQNLKKKLRIKVDGEESDVDLDFNDEEGLRRELQKSRAFDKRVKEFSSYKSQVEQMFQMLQTDPEGLLEKLGIDVDKLSEGRLSRKIEEMKKSPEQLEAEKMRKELEDYKKQEKELKSRAEHAELEKMRNQAASQIENDISAALEDVKSVLPKRNPAVMQRIAQTMLLAMQNGYNNVSAKDVIPLVEKQWKEEFLGVANGLPEDLMEEIFGKNNLDRYRKAKIKNKKSAPAAPQKPKFEDTGAKRTESKGKEEEPKKFNQVFDWRR